MPVFFTVRARQNAAAARGYRRAAAMPVGCIRLRPRCLLDACKPGCSPVPASSQWLASLNCIRLGRRVDRPFVLSDAYQLWLSAARVAAVTNQPGSVHPLAI